MKLLVPKRAIFLFIFKDSQDFLFFFQQHEFDEMKHFLIKPIKNNTKTQINYQEKRIDISDDFIPIPLLDFLQEKLFDFLHSLAVFPIHTAAPRFKERVLFKKQLISNRLNVSEDKSRELSFT